MRTWWVGDVSVTCVVERDLEGLLSTLLPDATADAITPLKWLFPHFADDQGQLRGNTQGVRIASKGEAALITGDFVHHLPVRPPGMGACRRSR